MDTKIRNRENRGRQILIIGENDLLSQRPDIAAQLLFEDPSKFCVKSGKIVSWRCPKDPTHIWDTTVIGRTRTRGTGCPFCAGQRAIFGVNDLQTLYPEVAKKLVGMAPETVCAHSSKRLWWICDKGHLTNGTPNNMVRSFAGCQICSMGGYSGYENGYLYFARHDYLGALQVGISNNPSTRLKTHEAKGWEILDLIGPMNGFRAIELETSIRKHLLKQGVEMRSKKRFMPTTMGEAWIEEEFPVLSINELLALVN